jgi:hypothetical protein
MLLSWVVSWSQNPFNRDSQLAFAFQLESTDPGSHLLVHGGAMQGGGFVAKAHHPGERIGSHALTADVT